MGGVQQAVRVVARKTYDLVVEIRHMYAAVESGTAVFAEGACRGGGIQGCPTRVLCSTRGERH